MRYLARRTFLRGVAGGGAIALGLPVLEAMLSGNGDAHADGTPLPKRFGLWFWGNGSDADNWAPAEQGAAWAPTVPLQPLAPHKDYVNVITGMTLPTYYHLGDPRAHNPHVEGVVGILTGGVPVIDPAYNGQNGDWNYMTVPRPSIDQLAAQVLGTGTRLPSLTLGITPVHGSSGPGTAVSFISHSAPYNYNAPRFSPREVFDRLFTGFTPPGTTPAPVDPTLRARARVLDAVAADARALKTKLGASDRRRVDQHLEAVGALERRLQVLAQPPPPPPMSACRVPTAPVDAASYREQARLMAELVAMAFACDITRVVSLQFSSPASHSNYPDIFPSGLVFNGQPTSFHEYEHSAGIDDTVRQGLRYFIELFAEFLGELKAVPEGAGHLLDQSCILGTSELSYGHRHGFTNYPLLVAGRAGGALKYPGVHLAAPGDLATRVPFTCLRAIGATQTSWGSDQFEVHETVAGIEA
jgi:hypothetical protein